MNTVHTSFTVECPECGGEVADVEVALTFWSDRHGFDYGPAEEGMEFEIESSTTCPGCNHDCAEQVESKLADVSVYDYDFMD